MSAAEKLGLRGERQLMRAWLGLPSGQEKRLALALQKAPSDAEKGEILLALGQFPEAEKALSAAMAQNAGSAELRALRGELNLLLGRFEQAGKDLDAAQALKNDLSAVFLHRAALAFKQAHFDEAQDNAARFEKLEPHSPLGPALRSILAARSGDAEAAKGALGEALACSPDGWIFALRGRLRASQADLQGAREDFDQAVKTEKAPWVRAERADILNRIGAFLPALAELRRLAKQLPQDPLPHARMAAIYLQQARFKPAAESYGQAIRRNPKSAALYHSRAQVFFIQGSYPHALKDFEKALAIDPRSPELRADTVRLNILCGKPARAKLLAESQVLPKGSAEHWKAYQLCREGRFEESEKLFSAAERTLPEGELKERASRYRLVAKLLKLTPPPAPIKGKVVRIMGLGYKQPDQVTVEALRDLRTCQTIYSNLSDKGIVDFLGLFPVKMKAIVFRRQHIQAHHASLDVMPGVISFDKVAVVTRANPLYYGRLAHRVITKAKKAGAVSFCSASVSIGEVFPALVGDYRGKTGFELRDSVDLADLNPEVPMIVYNLPNHPSERKERLAPVRKAYPPRHDCWLLAGMGDKEFEPVRTTIEEMDALLAHADTAVTLFFPAL